VDTERLWVSVFEDDAEAAKCWRKVGFPAARIVRLGAKDNFWGPAGATGAGGPSSEIYWDLGPEAASGEIGGGPGRDDRYIEVWNAVFPQFDRGGRQPAAPAVAASTWGGPGRIASCSGQDECLQRPTASGLMDGIAAVRLRGPRDRGPRACAAWPTTRARWPSR
jgi:alanyl-tRNA synthetase